MSHRLKLTIFFLLVGAVVADDGWQLGLIGQMAQPLIQSANKIVLSGEERTRQEHDRRRIDDLHQIQVALEAYITDHGTPPLPGAYG